MGSGSCWLSTSPAGKVCPHALPVLLYSLQAEPATVKEFDRQINLNESILRTKVLRADA